MTSPYPFYNQLLSEVQATNTMSIDWKSVSNTINTLNSQHGDIIYSLILHHYLVESKDVEGVISQLEQFNAKLSLQQPYGYRLFATGKGMTFTVSRLPPILQSIIYRYVVKASS